MPYDLIAWGLADLENRSKGKKEEILLMGIFIDYVG